MINVVCRCNLDYLEQEKWPSELPSVAVGQTIESGHRWPKMPTHGIELVVVDVTWRHARRLGWYAEVELHLPRLPFLSVSHWENWYDKVRGRIEEETYIQREKQIREEAYEQDIRRLRSSEGEEPMFRVLDRLDLACQQFFAADSAEPVRTNAKLEIESTLELLSDHRRSRGLPPLVGSTGQLAK